MARIVKPSSRSVNPNDDTRLARQRAMGLVTQSEQDLRISRLESVSQRQEKPWQFINTPWYYREIPVGTTTFLNPHIPMPTAVSTFAGISGRDFVCPVSGYIAGCYFIHNKSAAEFTAGSLSVVARKFVNASQSVNHVLAESRISFNMTYSSAHSYLLDNPAAGIPVGRGERWRPGFATDGLTWTGATTMVAQVMLIIAFKV